MRQLLRELILLSCLVYAVVFGVYKLGNRNKAVTVALQFFDKGRKSLGGVKRRIVEQNDSARMSLFGHTLGNLRCG